MALLAATTPSSDPSPAPAPPGAVVIVNSGSTNTAGYRVVILRGGSAHITIQGHDPRSATVSAATSKALFTDVDAAMPLDAIKTEPCMHSASFGTTTHVSYAGKESPDLSCATGDAATRLGADVAKVADELQLRLMPRARGLTVQPSTAPSDTH